MSGIGVFLLLIKLFIGKAFTLPMLEHMPIIGYIIHEVIITNSMNLVSPKLANEQYSF